MIVPTTQGMLNSRAEIAAWERRPPLSDTTKKNEK